MKNYAGSQLLVSELARYPGVDGCALVDAETGMTWFHAGTDPAMDRTGEAAIEFWRVQRRLGAHFEALGPLQSAAYAFAHRVVALFPCSDKPALVLVCIAHKKDVSWNEWGAQVLRLKKVLEAEHAVDRRR